MFIVALFMKTRKWNQPRCLSTEEWILCVCVYVYVRARAHIQTFFRYKICNKIDKLEKYKY